jgi:hypothetical protein
MDVPQLKPTLSKKNQTNLESLFLEPNLIAGRYFSTLCEKWLTINVYARSKTLTQLPLHGGIKKKAIYRVVNGIKLYFNVD